MAIVETPPPFIDTDEGTVTTASETERFEVGLGALVAGVRTVPVGSADERSAMANDLARAGMAIILSGHRDRMLREGRLNCHERDDSDLAELLPELVCPFCDEQRLPARLSWQIPLRRSPFRLNIGRVPGYHCEGCGDAFPWPISIDLFLHAAAFAALVGDSATAADLGRRALATRVQHNPSITQR